MGHSSGNLTAKLRKYDLEGFHPNWCIRPGVTMQEWLDENGMSQAELARRLGVSAKHVNQVIQGKAVYSAQFAVRLGAVTGVSPEFWYRLQCHWVIGKAMGKKETL